VNEHPTRQQVYAAIDTERDYQDSLPPNRTDGRQHTVGDYILMMEEYVALARVSWVNQSGDYAALDVIRKVAGIAVRCMEEHGAINRC
jgi:hypothetical protein